MKLLKYIFGIFKAPTVGLLPKGTRIRLLFTEGANISTIPITSINELNFDDYVTITKYSTLVYSHENKTKIYFKVKSHWVEMQHEAPNDSIIYFTKQRFNNTLIYKPL